MNLVGLLLLSALTFTACSEEETAAAETFTNTEVITVAELQYSDEAEQMVDDIAEIAEDAYVSDEMSVTSKGIYLSELFT